MTRPASRVALLCAFAALVPAAQADIFRCTGPDGHTLYSDAACPSDSLHHSNITADIVECSTAECEAARAQQADEARERLRAERAELEILAERRRAQAIEAEREQARAEELRWRQSMEERLAILAQEADATAGYPLYGAYPVYVFPRPCTQRCLQPSQARRPHPDPAQARPKGHGQAILQHR